MTKQYTYQWVFLASAGIFLSSCSTNNELFAKYDENCDLPKTKVIEKVKYVDRVKTVHVSQPIMMRGMHWEPAVYFGFDLEKLEGLEQKRLDNDAKILNKNKHLKVSIQAFTDVKGSDAYNKVLAVKRQYAVVDYLMNLGIQKERILTSPLGEGLPILGQSKSERSINRRVELMLLDATGRPLALEIKPAKSEFKAPLPVK